MLSRKVSHKVIDERFGTFCNDDEIVKRGFSLLLQDQYLESIPDLTCPIEELLIKLDRQKVVSFHYGTLLRILKLFNMNESEINEIITLRKRENKRLSTAKYREKVKFNYLEELEIIKAQLEREKQELQHEVLHYQKLQS